MRRLLALLTTSLLTLALLGGVAQAGNHDHDHEDTEEHPHVMLLNFELVDPGPTDSPFDDTVSFDQCIDLANNQRLTLRAHHHSLHTGTAGFGNPQVGITRAGHVVLPLQPYEGGLPFEDCAQIEPVFG